MKIPVTGLGSVGLVADVPHYELPLNAWTSVQNVRFHSGAVERILGYSEVFGTPLVSPQWLLHTASGATPLWLYASPTGVAATDGATHADITRTSGAYTMSQSVGWTGTVIEDIPVINNGFDPPQMWNKPSLSQKLQDLTAWPNGVSANTLRGLKRYLVALDVTKQGTRFPNMIKWSHQSPEGAVPLSWNEADETGDAGEWTLPGVGGYLVDAVPLRDDLMLYKEYETWLMQYVGGQAVFTFLRKFKNVGMLSRKCAVEFFAGKHFVFTGDDAIVHDGQNADSVMTERVHSLIEDVIDPANMSHCFVAPNFRRREVWVCIPERGFIWPNRALVWNWQRNSWSDRDLPKVGHIENGIIIPSAESDVWDDDTEVWDDDTSLWGDRAFEPTRQNMLMASPEASRLYVPGQGLLAGSGPMVCFAERTGLGFPVESGQPPDYSRMKQVISLFPRISGTVGGVVNVSLGIQDQVDGPVNWQATRPYIIGSTDMLDFSDTDASRLHALRFESNTAIRWRLSAYDAEVIDRGAY